MRAAVIIVAIAAAAVLMNGLRDTRTGLEITESYKKERQTRFAHLTDSELRASVDLLFTRNDPERANFQGLLYNIDRSLPYLIQVLDEPRSHFSGIYSTHPTRR